MLSLFNRLSLTQQWISATLLAMLPLVVAVSYAGWSLAEQTRSQKALVSSIGKLNRIDAALSDQLTEFQRSGRQYILINKPKFLALVEQDLSTLQQYGNQLSKVLPNAEARNLIKSILNRSEMITTRLKSYESGDNSKDVLLYLRQSKQEMVLVNDAVSQHIEHLLKESDSKFHSILQHLFLIGVLAIPGTILLLVLSSVAVVHPILRLAAAIRDLGHGRWQTPIKIHGAADLNSLGNNLEWMREQLLLSERQKQAFLMHVTHELKTPLAAITEAGSLLKDEVPGKICESQHQVLEILLDNAENLQALIQQLLNYNAVSHGLDRNDSNVNIEQVCKRAQTKLLSTQTATKHSWKIEGPDLIVETDAAAIDMILSNLLSNAFLYTQENGQIDISWGINEKNWWLVIGDNGPGIPEEEIESIYQPFYQGRAQRSGPLKGSGMGLAIVHECVAQLNGDIEVKSELQKGTEFTISFPMKEGTQ